MSPRVEVEFRDIYQALRDISTPTLEYARNNSKKRIENSMKVCRAKYVIELVKAVCGLKSDPVYVSHSHF